MKVSDKKTTIQVGITEWRIWEISDDALCFKFFTLEPLTPYTLVP
jgi:hypothetical protein